MSSIIDYFPVEIHERILSYLSGDSLISVSKVCRLWNILAERIAKIQYEEIVPPECVEEVERQTSCSDDNPWLQALSYHSLEQHLINNLLGYKLPLYCVDVVCQKKKVCYVPFGSSCFISECEKLRLYDAEFGKQALICMIFKGHIRQLLVVPKLKVLIVISDKFEFFEIPEISRGINKLKKLKMYTNSHLYNLDMCESVSVDDSCIAVQMDQLTLLAYQLEIEDDRINVIFVNSYQFPHKIYHFSLWDSEVLVLLEIGQIVLWPITCKEHFPCGMYQEIRYANPVWIFRGRVFCSTVTSRALLGLWHLEVGTYYWLIGKPKWTLLRCFNLDPLIGHVIEETSTVCLKQRLLFCGTNGGKVVIYYLSSCFFYDKDSYDRDDIHNEFNRDPDMVINVCNGPIEDVKVEFTENKIYIVVRSVKIQRTVSCIQSIVLSQIKSANEGNVEITIDS